MSQKTTGLFKTTGIVLAVMLLTGNSLAQSPQELLVQLQLLRAEMQDMRQELDALKRTAAARSESGVISRRETGGVRYPPRRPS